MIVTCNIRIELKATQKKFWPIFLVQVRKFSLLNLGNSKVEATALGEIKLLDLKHKIYDPYKIVGNHQAHYNLKAYEHEQSVRRLVIVNDVNPSHGFLDCKIDKGIWT